MTQSNQPPQLSYSLESILTKLEQKIDQLDSKLEQKIDQLDSKLEQKIEKLESKLEQKIDKLDSKIDKLESKIDNLQKEVTDFKAETGVGMETVKGDIKALDEKVNGLSKRLENQEFVNRGILVALVVAIIGSAAKLLGWVGKP